MEYVKNMWKLIGKLTSDNPTWDYRLLRRYDPQYDSEDVMIVEVYYEEGHPHNWAYISNQQILELDLMTDRSESDIKNKFARLLLKEMAAINKALEKPILQESDFLTYEK